MILKHYGTATINFSNSLLARLDINNGDGYWRKEGDFNLVLGSTAVNLKSKSGMLRVIQYAEKYRLIIEDYEGLDMWDGSLGFKKTNTLYE
ncbi:hypothetical protein [Zooshikella ganghwensis]|uniref:hypothetical protein n=1 Tax=Zooshikella ganghwensis TaxID=202772 RepID=UPI000426DD31|nr:hypothetical protein [Zooshikella ganghwensis]